MILLLLFFLQLPVFEAQEFHADILVRANKAKLLNEDLWVIEIESYSGQPLDYVLFEKVTKKTELSEEKRKLILKYCSNSSRTRERCGVQRNHTRVTWYLARGLTYARIEMEARVFDSGNYTLEMEADNKTQVAAFELFVLLPPKISHFVIIPSSILNEGSALNVECRIHSGYPEATVRLEVLRGTIWVAVKSVNLKKMKSDVGSIISLRWTKDRAVREFNAVRCAAIYDGAKEKQRTLTTYILTTSRFNESQTLRIFCPLEGNVSLRDRRDLFCKHERSGSLENEYFVIPPSSLGPWIIEKTPMTFIIKKLPGHVTTEDAGSYECSFDNRTYCSRYINILSRSTAPMPKAIVQMNSRRPLGAYKNISVSCITQTSAEWTQFFISISLKTERWSHREAKYFSSSSGSNLTATFVTELRDKCSTLLVVCRVVIIQPFSDESENAENYRMACPITETIWFEPNHFKMPLLQDQEIHVLGIDATDVEYKWERVKPEYEVYEDPPANLRTKGNVLTIPHGEEYRGGFYNYSCYAFRKVGGIEYRSNVITIAFHTGICENIPRIDIFFGLHTSPNGFCSLNDSLTNDKETWFELFYRPFLYDIIMSLPISSNLSRFVVIPISSIEDSRSGKLLPVQANLTIKLSESTHGRHYIANKLMNMSRAKLFTPHTSKIKTCPLFAYQTMLPYYQKTRNDSGTNRRLFLFGIDAWDHGHYTPSATDINYESLTFNMPDMSTIENLRELDALTNGMKAYGENIDKLGEGRWLLHLSYCPHKSCPNEKAGRTLGIAKSFFLINRPNVMYSSFYFWRQFNRSYVPRSNDRVEDKCLIEKSMPEIRIRRTPLLQAICSKSKQDFIGYLKSVKKIDKECIQGLTITIEAKWLHLSEEQVSCEFNATGLWHNIDLRSEYTSKRAVSIGTFQIPKIPAITSLNVRVRCSIMLHDYYKWREIGFICKQMVTRPPSLTISPLVIIEGRAAEVKCLYDFIKFVGEVKLTQQIHDEDEEVEIERKSIHLPYDSKTVAITHVISNVSLDIDYSMFRCHVLPKYGKETHVVQKLFEVTYALVHNLTMTIETGPSSVNRSIKESNIFHGYWVSITCSALVGTKGSLLTLVEKKNDRILTEYALNTSCYRNPPQFGLRDYECSVEQRLGRIQDFFEIRYVIKNAMTKHDQRYLTCLARNNFSQAEIKEKLVVWSRPKFENFVYQARKNRLTSECQVHSHPAPNVSVKIEPAYHGKIIGFGVLETAHQFDDLYRKEMFFSLDDLYFLGTLTCRASSIILNETISIEKKIVAYMRENTILFNKTIIEPEVSSYGTQFTATCTFDAVFFSMATSVILFKKVKIFDFNMNLPCMLLDKQKLNLYTGIALCRHRKGSVVANNTSVVFKIDEAVVRDAGRYTCGTFLSTGQLAYNEYSNYFQVMSKPKMPKIYFKSEIDSSNDLDSGTHSSEKPVWLECQGNMGLGTSTKGMELHFAQEGFSVNPLSVSRRINPDNTVTLTARKFIESLPRNFHNNTFTCTGRSGLGIGPAATRQLLVQHPPFDVTINATKFGFHINESMLCTSKGYPKPTYYWTDGVSGRKLSHSAILNLNQLSPGFHEILCEAINSFDQKQHSAHVFLKFFLVTSKDFKLRSKPDIPIVGGSFSLICPFYNPDSEAEVHWFRKQKPTDVGVIIAKWSYATKQFVHFLHPRKLQFITVQPSVLLVFERTKTTDNAHFECHYVLRNFRVKALSDEICIYNPPSEGRLNLNPQKKCYLEHRGIIVSCRMRLGSFLCLSSMITNETLVLSHFHKNRDLTRYVTTTLSKPAASENKEATWRLKTKYNFDGSTLSCGLFGITNDGKTHALTDLGDPDLKVSLCVLYRPRQLIFDPPLSIVLRSTVLKCRALGNPKPKIQIVLQGNPVTEEMNEASLTIPDSLDKGEYTVKCVATNIINGNKETQKITGVILIRGMSTNMLFKIIFYIVIVICVFLLTFTSLICLILFLRRKQREKEKKIRSRKKRRAGNVPRTNPKISKNKNTKARL